VGLGTSILFLSSSVAAAALVGFWSQTAMIVEYNTDSSLHLEWHGQTTAGGKRISGHNSRGDAGNLDILFNFKSIRLGPCP
jgi:hypothetical protein